jgi:hypothetical protein
MKLFGIATEFPQSIEAYHARLAARPAYQRAVATP